MTGYKHGHAVAGNRSPTYRSWAAMRVRLSHKPEYAEVTCDPRWSRFSIFLHEMGERPEGMTLDRIDGRLGYCKENCRWATHVEQSRNKVEQKGVGWAKQQGKFKAWIGIDGSSVHLGYFADWWEAMCARKSAENKYWRSA